MFIIAALLLNVNSALVDVSIQQHRREIITVLEQFDNIDWPLLRKKTDWQTAQHVSTQGSEAAFLPDVYREEEKARTVGTEAAE
jgi:hypothetical protein